MIRSRGTELPGQSACLLIVPPSQKAGGAGNMVNHTNEESNRLDRSAGLKSIIQEYGGPCFGFKDIHCAKRGWCWFNGNFIRPTGGLGGVQPQVHEQGSSASPPSKPAQLPSHGPAIPPPLPPHPLRQASGHLQGFPAPLASVCLVLTRPCRGWQTARRKRGKDERATWRRREGGERGPHRRCDPQRKGGHAG